MSDCPYVFYPMRPDWNGKCVRIYHCTSKLIADCSGRAPTAVQLVDFYAAILEANRQLGEQLPAFAAQLAIEAAVTDAAKAKEPLKPSPLSDEEKANLD